MNRNGQVVCRDVNAANNSVSYLKIQAEKFGEKESEEDDVPDLVDPSSSSSSESAESEDETEV